MRVLALGLLLGFAVLLAACTSVEEETYAGKPRLQYYELDQVEQRLPQLQEGMSKGQVLLILGSPAIEKPGYWDYYPSRTGTIIPASAIRVNFTDNRYTGWKRQPIILGEKLDG